MRFLAISSLIVVTFLPAVSAHYRWTSLVVNGTTTAQYQYVRVNTNYNSPVTDVTSTDIRCNTGGLASGASTGTATVQAGTTVGVALDQAIYHPGVINVYLSKAPSTAASYDGSGQWFKVYQISAVTDGGKSISWPANNLASVSFKLPSSTPSGEYLLRVEHIALHSATSVNGAQFYISCANIKVVGGGSGTPGPTISLPGGYKATDPGIQININYPIPPTYVQPGPTVWSG